MCIFTSSKRETTDCETTLKHFVMVIQTHSPAQGKNKHPITTSKEPVNSHLLTPSTWYHFALITCRGFQREPIPSPAEGSSSDNSGWTNTTPFRTSLLPGQTACQLERKRILKIKIPLHFPRGSPHNEKWSLSPLSTAPVMCSNRWILLLDSTLVRNKKRFTILSKVERNISTV